MKKIITKALTTGIIIAMAAFIILGIYIKNQMKQTGGTGFFLDTEALTGKLPFVASPDTAGKGSFANSMYMMNSSFSDSVVTSKSGWGDISLETRHVLIDNKGNIIRSGIIAVAETQKCFLDEYKSCTDYNTSYGLVNVTNTFNDVQLKKISEEMIQKTISLKIDSYYMSGVECFPARITVFLADEPMYLLDCTVPEEVRDLELIEDSPLWMHDPSKTDWKNAPLVREGSELSQWCSDNMPTLFSSDSPSAGASANGIRYEKIDLTSLWSGLATVTVYSDNDYALVFLQKLNCHNILISVLVRSLCIGAGVAILFFIVLLLRRKKK